MRTTLRFTIRRAWLRVLRLWRDAARTDQGVQRAKLDPEQTRDKDYLMSEHRKGL